jgi:hypothetical protein
VINLKLIDWPFFVALFFADIAGVCARRFNRAYPEDRPGWAGTSACHTTITLINLPFAFGDAVLLAGGFLMLPWYTVVISGTAAFLAMLLFWNLLFRRLVRLFGLFVAMLISYPAAVASVIWCFQEEYLIPPTLASYIGIAVILCSRAMTAFYAYRRTKWRP